MLSQSEQEVRSGLPKLLPRMWRYALVLSKNRDVADDITQASAERALSRANQFQAGTRLDAWVFSIISSTWKNQLRSDKVRRGQGIQSIDDAGLTATVNELETNIFGNQVFNLIMQLPLNQKDAVFLVYIEGYSYKEAAGMLEIPIGTVMSRLAAGRKKINDAVNNDHARMFKQRTEK